MDNSLEEKEMSNSHLVYDKIPPFHEQTDFIELTRKISSLLKETREHEWIEHVQAINYIRRLRKYNKQVFKIIMYDLDIFDIILSFLNSLRTTLCKVTLVFVQELFSEYEFEYDNNDEQIGLLKFIQFITPKLLLKANSEKNFIKEEAINCLKKISENMIYGDTLITLTKCCLDKGNNICELSFKCIEELIPNFDVNYLLYFDYWNEFFSVLVQLIKKKKEPYIKKSFLIINLLEESIGKENFDKIINENCKKDEKELIEKNKSFFLTTKLKKLNDKKENKIRDLIKEHRNHLKKQISEKVPINIFIPKKTNLN